MTFEFNFGTPLLYCFRIPPLPPISVWNLTLQSCVSKVASRSTLNSGEEWKEKSTKILNTFVCGCSYLFVMFVSFLLNSNCYFTYSGIRHSSAMLSSVLFRFTHSNLIVPTFITVYW